LRKPLCAATSDYGPLRLFALFKHVAYKTAAVHTNIRPQMSSDRDLLTTIARVDGPDSLRRFLQQQSDYRNPAALMKQVLRTAVLHSDARLLEEFPHLVIDDRCNALTELIQVEHDLRCGDGALTTVEALEPNGTLRTSIRAVVIEAMRRMRPFAAWERKYHNMALTREAYYVFEALPHAAFESLANHALFSRTSWWSVRSHVFPVAQDSLARLVPPAPYEELQRVHERLMKGYNQVWLISGLGCIETLEHAYGRLGVIQVNVALITHEMRARRRLMLFIAMCQPKGFRSQQRGALPMEVYDMVEAMADLN
jgi:hypothetical protein